MQCCCERCLHKPNLSCSGSFLFFQALTPSFSSVLHLHVNLGTQCLCWERPALCTPDCWQRLPSGENSIAYKTMSPVCPHQHPTGPQQRLTANNTETSTGPEGESPACVAESSLLGKPIQGPKILSWCSCEASPSCSIDEEAPPSSTPGPCRTITTGIHH